MEWYPSLALVWEPFASPLKIGAAGVVLAALAVFASARIYREHPGAAVVLLLMRLGVIAAVTALLCGPSRELPQSPQQIRPRLTVLVDTSESMLTGDCAGATRIGFVAGQVLSGPQWRELQSQFDVQVQGFDVDVRPLSLDQVRGDPAGVASGRATHLSEAVSRTVSRVTGGDTGDVVLVVSDGRDTEDAPVQPVAELARARGVPVFAVGVGGDQSAVDAAVLAVPMQDALLPGEPGGILLKVYQSGLDGATAVATLQGHGETQRVRLEFGSQQVIETQLIVEREEPGQYEFEVSLAPVGDETELTNNSQTVFVEVLKRKLRVLLLEGEPFWDTKFLAQSLRKDEQVELTQITQVGAARQEKIVTRQSGAAPQVPRSAEEWDAYDVVVFGRGLDRLLDAESATALVEFVHNGGHLVMSRGPAWDAATESGAVLQTALNVLLPVVWGADVSDALALELTSAGRGTAWFATTKMGVDVEAALARLPGFEQMTGVEREKGGALVLARTVDGGGSRTAGLPAIVRMPYGRGQVVAILGEGLWKWGLLPPDLQDLRGFYDTFWSNLVRWLSLGGDFAPGQQVSLQLSRTSARLGDELTIDVVYRQPPLSGAEPQLEVAGPRGDPVEAALHELPGQSPRYRATLSPTETGVHRVRVQAPGMSPAVLEKRLNVYEVNLERLQTSANYLALQILAEHSGGAMFEAGDLSALGPALSRHRQSLVIPPQREYLWDRGWIMTLLLVWAGAEWLFRRAVGLW